MTVKLGEPTWSTEVDGIRFFNGRVLTGDDLTREQQAVARRDADLAAAIGAGIVRGLLVTAVAGTNPAKVTVRGGVAIAPDGSLVELDGDVELELVVPSVTTAPTPGTFRLCGGTSGSITTTGPGVYVLIAQGASKDDGRAEVGGVERYQSDPCTADHRKAGVAFRLQRLDAIEASLPADDRRRSHAAHLCLGTVSTGSPGAVNPDRGEPGRRAIADLRVPNSAGASKLARCEVPLALLELQSGSTPLRWLDVWAARRRTAGTEVVRAEHEAVVAQFADQYGETAMNGAAASRYPWLPPCGVLVASEAWAAFLAVHAPPAITTVDAGLLPAIFEGGIPADPFATRDAGGPLGPEDAPVVVDVFQAAGGGPLVFARSRLGRLRVELSGLTLASGAGIEVFAVGPDGIEALATFVTSSAPAPGFWVFDRLVPGSWTVRVKPGIVEMTGAAAAANVVGGQLARMTVPVQHGASVTVVVTNADLAPSALSISIGGQAVAVSSSRSATKGALPAGTYAVTVSATGYTAYSGSAVLQAGEDETITVTLQAIPEEEEVPDCCLTTTGANKTKVKLCLKLLAWHLHSAGKRTMPDYEPEADFYWLCGEKSPGRAIGDKGAAYAYANRKPGAKGKRALVKIGQAKKSFFPNYEPLSRYAVPPDAGPDVLAWLLDWRPVLANHWPDAKAAVSIGKSTPVLKTLDGESLASLASRTVTDSKAFVAEAHFGSLIIPVSVARNGRDIGVKWPPIDVELIPPWMIDIVFELPPIWFDDFVTDPPDWFREVLFEDRREWVKDDLFGHIDDKVREKVETLEFLPFGDRLGGDLMRKLFDGNAVLIANLTPARLDGILAENELQMSSYEKSIFLDAAREMVPAQSWDVKTMGQTGERLAASGVTTLGEAATLGESAIGKSLGVDAAQAATITKSLQTTLVAQAAAEEYGNLATTYEVAVEGAAAVKGATSGYRPKTLSAAAVATETAFLGTWATSLEGRLTEIHGIKSTVKVVALETFDAAIKVN